MTADSTILIHFGISPSRGRKAREISEEYSLTCLFVMVRCDRETSISTKPLICRYSSMAY
jgi:hypothetical protein